MKNNPYENRWKPWYAAIAEWMIANPGKGIADCAAALGRGESTLYMITNTDMFREYYAQRREAWEKMHDSVLVSKLHKVAERGLDEMLHRFETKRDALPFGVVQKITEGALDRLGYSVSKPTPAVQVNVQNSQTVVPVDRDLLEDARARLRAVEAQKHAQLPPPSEARGADRLTHTPIVIEGEADDPPSLTP